MGMTRNSCLVIMLQNFSLTPALSLGERVNCHQSVGEPDPMRDFKSQVLLFPLPGGEGQGEGGF